MTTRTTSLMAAFIAAASFAASPAAAQTDTAKVAPTTAAPATAAPAATARAAAPAPRRRNHNEITRADMLEKGARNVYDGIRMVRGSWLRPSRALTSANIRNPQVAVYRDGALAGTVNVLRDLPVESISHAQYFEPNEAVQRFGTDASAGAIVVHSGSGG